MSSSLPSRLALKLDISGISRVRCDGRFVGIARTGAVTSRVLGEGARGGGAELKRPSRPGPGEEWEAETSRGLEKDTRSQQGTFDGAGF